jgi:hypothetical protein
MIFHQFTATPGTAQALAGDRAGSRLPKLTSGVWRYLKQVDVGKPNGESPVGANEVLAAIEKNGYFLWPETPTTRDQDTR